MSSGKIDEIDQIVASGEALSVVSKWLGVSSFQDALAADPVQSSTEELRPPLLGLGADPRKYHKALTAASKLERKLGQRLKGQLHEQQSPAAINRNGGANTGKAADARESSDGEEEDEDEGRAGAIQKQKRPPQQDLTTYHSKGKKKKKKQKQHA